MVVGYGIQSVTNSSFVARKCDFVCARVVMKLVKWSVQPKTMSSYQRLSESNDAPAPTPTSRYGHSIIFLLLCAEFLGHVDANLCYVLSKWRNTFLQLSLIVNINRLDLSQCPYLPLAHGWPPDCLVLPRWVVGGWVVMQPVVEIISQTPSLHPAPPPARRKSKATQDLSGLSTNSFCHFVLCFWHFKVLHMIAFWA